jgi:hypothetical protein
MIIFHCESCKKKIKAPDEAGGKWGVCPYCKHRCYIPLPPSEDEPELKLVPLDEDEEKQRDEMMRETYNLQQNILQERNGGGEDPQAAAGAAISEKELIKAIILYLRQMADGLLEQAEDTAKTILRHQSQAKDILQRMARAEQPEPELADISPKLLQGFMKQLYSLL